MRISLKPEGFELLEAEKGEMERGLCARHSPDLVILDLSARDYVTKPFRVDDLLSRVRTQLRIHQKGNDSVASETSAPLDSGALHTDLVMITEEL